MLSIKVCDFKIPRSPVTHQITLYNAEQFSPPHNISKPKSPIILQLLPARVCIKVSRRLRQTRDKSCKIGINPGLELIPHSEMKMWDLAGRRNEDMETLRTLL